MLLFDVHMLQKRQQDLYVRNHYVDRYYHNAAVLAQNDTVDHRDDWVQFPRQSLFHFHSHFPHLRKQNA